MRAPPAADGAPADAAAEEPSAAHEPEGEAEQAPPDFVHGSLSMRYRDQRTDSQRDRDLFALLDAEMGDPSKDPWTATVIGRLAYDLDGGGKSFSSPEDTFDGSLTGQLYEAHLDLRDVPSVEVISIGRQELAETPAWVRFDGATIETEPAGAGQQTWGFYSGRTVHLWESSSQDDALLGGWWIDHPWDGGRTRLDWMHLEDQSLLGSNGSNADDLIAVQLHQNLEQSTQLQGDYSWLGGTPRDVRLTGTWHDAGSDVLVHATCYELLSTQFDLVEEIDPFSSTLFAQFPYREGTIVASKSWNDDFDLEAGADVRRVIDSNDVTAFNRDFEHYHLTGTQHHVFTDGLSLGLSGEIWDSQGTSQTSWGLDATHEWSKRLRASLGTYYALYKNDFIAGEERDDVRTWYASVRYLTESKTTWTLGCDLEDTSVGTFHTVRLGAIWRF